MRSKSRKRKELFVKKIERDSRAGCWEWTGWRRGDYGGFWDGYRHVFAHRFAWELWVGPIPEGLCVCHHCDNPPCVNPAHLFVGTSTDNNRDMIAKGREARGERSGRAKLTDKAVAEIRDSLERPYILAKRYGVSLSTISTARTGRSWKHLPGAAPGLRVLRGEQIHLAKLTDDAVRVIRASDLSADELAARYGVRARAIKDVLVGRTWKHVDAQGRAE